MCYIYQQVENMEAQIADILADRNRASETISSLRVRAVLCRTPLNVSVMK